MILHILFYLLMSLDTHMFTWLISGAVNYHTSDDAAFPEADGLYSAM